MGFFDRLFQKPAEPPREPGTRDAVVPPEPVHSNLPDPTGEPETVKRDYEARLRSEAAEREAVEKVRRDIKSSGEHGAASM